ncbi:Ent-kaurene synthase [Zopfia rhizophila CBS 207.26]|uniref:Ent-kaurene synthase n=1 Tax=Zopfia rhizophila CBS 207.26 TaxID=1314779 RepID=A0A6A6DY00_9PEZI|nr:Ent-kaurene synthase [Zopfia rhizophila CBS 207.26]
MVHSSPLSIKMPRIESLKPEASLLIEQLATKIKHGRPSSSMSTSTYDTAWVSMVAKSESNGKRWLFPESFQVILDTQQLDGSWSGASELDTILNTMAALLSILMHNSESDIAGGFGIPSDITARTSRAATWLHSRMRKFKISDCTDNVAFEILLLNLLKRLEVYGMSFPVPGLSEIFKMSEKKFQKLNLEAIYAGQKSTVLHSLEALIGRADFDRLRGQLVHGSMMGSPSSTAAYLMCVSEWDFEAEDYLRRVFEDGEGKGTGAFPSAFPTEIFETSWVVSTLLESGVFSDLLGKDLQFLGDYLGERMNIEGGILGFSTGLMPDADDTAKSIQSLLLLGRIADPQPMITAFGADSCFKTYEAERNPSLSANCNILKALVCHPEASMYSESIMKAANFVCQSWLSRDVNDKWNLSAEYTILLLCQGLTKLLQVWEEGSLHCLPKKTFNFEIPIILAQILGRTLNSQNADGSWGNQSCEITAYGILTLIQLSSVPSLVSFVRKDVLNAIEKGRVFLQLFQGNWPSTTIWIEKVTYSSDILTRTYCISALHAPIPANIKSSDSLGAKETKALKLCHLFKSLPLFSKIENLDLKLRTSVVESMSLLPYIINSRLNIFPRAGMEKEKYLEIIPFAWTACNTMLAHPLPTNALLDMMMVSMLNFQADEYIETAVRKNFAHDTEPVRRIVDKVCGISTSPSDESLNGQANGYDAPDRAHNGHLSAPSNGKIGYLDSLADIESVLTQYVDYVLSNTSIQSSHPSLRCHVRDKLAGYLQAQITSVENNTRLQQLKKYSLINWVRTTGADDTSCPYSFAFYLCLITTLQTNKSPDRGFSAIQEYLLWDMCGHLATMCRMYNDYGSLARDREEGHLNCADFLVNEFGAGTKVSKANSNGLENTVGNGERVNEHQSEESVESRGQKRKLENGDADTTNDVRRRVNGLGEAKAKHVTGGVNGTSAPHDPDKLVKRSILSLADHERESMSFAFEKLKTGENDLGRGIISLLQLFINVTDLFGQIYVAKDIGTRTG